MSESIKLFHPNAASEESVRSATVIAVLEIVKARMLAGKGSSLGAYFDSLDGWADQVEGVLAIKQGH